MRDIIFRAKRTDNGEWVEGSLIDSGNHEQVMIYPHYDGASTMGVRQLVYYSSVPVDHDTVCEWTGLTDKNGKKIFEGDVVRFKRTDALGWTRERIGKVLYYDKLPIFYILSTTGDAWDWCVCEDIEVIGNIYDNPDLIER